MQLPVDGLRLRTVFPMGLFSTTFADNPQKQACPRV